jgi:hypothetical protein
MRNGVCDYKNPITSYKCVAFMFDTVSGEAQKTSGQPFVLQLYGAPYHCSLCLIILGFSVPYITLSPSYTHTHTKRVDTSPKVRLPGSPHNQIALLECMCNETYFLFMFGYGGCRLTCKRTHPFCTTSELHNVSVMFAQCFLRILQLNGVSPAVNFILV